MDHETYTGKDGREITIRMAVPEDYPDAITTYSKVAREKIYIIRRSLLPMLRMSGRKGGKTTVQACYSVWGSQAAA